MTTTRTNPRSEHGNASHTASVEDPTIDEYLDGVWLERGLSPNTLAAYRRDLTQLHLALGKRLLDATEADLHGVVADRFETGYKARSAARFLSCVRGFYRQMVRSGRLQTDPAAHLAAPKLGRSLPGTLSEMEVRKLLDARGRDVAHTPQHVQPPRRRVHHV